MRSLFIIFSTFFYLNGSWAQELGAESAQKLGDELEMLSQSLLQPPAEQVENATNGGQEAAVTELPAEPVIESLDGYFDDISQRAAAPVKTTKQREVPSSPTLKRRF